MAVHTGDESLENTTNSEPEGHSGVTPPSASTETIDSDQSIISMEVHHHPDLHHKQKKGKEYFLEFCMIFLAVTMGFFAENIREHFTETKIARQNLESYRNDLLQNEKLMLRLDTTISNRLPLYDSIVDIFYEKRENAVLSALSGMLLAGQRNLVISINTPTYEQLISSGGLRYIENRQLKDSMANYQLKINSLINYNDRLISTLNNQLGDIGKIEDMHDFWNRHKSYTGYRYTPDMQPFTLTPEQRNFIIEYNRLFSIQTIVVSSRLKELLNSIRELVKMVDKELDQ